MNINKLYECLSDQEKSSLLYLLKKERVNASQVLHIYDWVQQSDLSCRVANALLAKYPKYKWDSELGEMIEQPFKTADDITELEFFSIKNLGWRSYDEFLKARGDF